jgi:hypothetical protein
MLSIDAVFKVDNQGFKKLKNLILIYCYNLFFKSQFWYIIMVQKV